MKTIASIVICSLLFASAGLPQDKPMIGGAWSALNSVRLGQNLQVNLNDGKSIKGQMIEISDTSLHLNVNGNVFSCPSSQIKRVYILRGRPVVRRTAIGAALGAGSGAAIGAIATRNDDWFGPGLGALVLGGIGLVVGTILGFSSGIRQKKDLVYEAVPVRPQ